MCCAFIFEEKQNKKTPPYFCKAREDFYIEVYWHMVAYAFEWMQVNSGRSQVHKNSQEHWRKVLAV